MLTKEHIQRLTKLLRDELQVATGCTEPIALAYCAAYARQVLGELPERYIVRCSGNIIKNVKSVVVPNTGGLKGIAAAVAAGAIGGDARLKLDVLSHISAEHAPAIKSVLEKSCIEVTLLESSHPLHIIVEVFAGRNSASVEIIDSHSNIGNVLLNGEYIHRRSETQAQSGGCEGGSLNVRVILEYADTVEMSLVRDILERQVEYNTAIANAGLSGDWGAGVGKLLFDKGGDIQTRIKASAAAGSDARMNGLPLPVVINAGSGNQGITVSVPVIEYARFIGASNEKMLRALCVSNLVSIHQKSYIGKLSAYCGAVSAATGGIAGIAYLDGQSYECIAQTIINSLGNVSGMVCDGAKSSCAAKIASALDGAILAYDMAKRGGGFLDGEGIVSGDVEKTIANVGRMAACGMAKTDIEILNIMIEK